jgi:hypothetical protein
VKRILAILFLSLLFTACNSIPSEMEKMNVCHIDLIKESRILYGEDYYFNDDGQLYRIDFRGYVNTVNRSTFFSIDNKYLKIKTIYSNNTESWTSYDFENDLVELSYDQGKLHKIQKGNEINIYYNELVLPTNIEIGYIDLLYNKRTMRFRVVIDISNKFSKACSNNNSNRIIAIGDKNNKEYCMIVYENKNFISEGR